MKKASIHNLGCKVNAYEAESMEQSLIKAGYEIVPFADDTKADVVIINTCSVTNIADHKSRQMLHKAKKLNPDAIVIAAGCYVQGAADEIKKDPAIDIILGNNRKNDLVKVIAEFEAQRNGEAAPDEAMTDLIDINHDSVYEEMKVESVHEHTRAYIKVQDGCNQFCTYCIIPYVRGRIRSRKEEDVIDEITGLVSKGYKEFVLTGIHLASFGRDQKDSDATLLSLIVKVSEIPGVERIRLGSLEPNVITEEFAKTTSALKNFCPHFHLALQAGSDSVLHKMNRHYTTEDYMNGVNMLRKYFNDPAITTDIIVGFPQESEEEFNSTVEFVKQVDFYECHIFKYSKRKGTIAESMEGQIEEAEKTRRSSVLLNLTKGQAEKYRKAYIGSETDVLLEEPVKVGDTMYMTGFTMNYMKVLVPAADLIVKYAQIDPDKLAGQIVHVTLTGESEDGKALVSELA